MATVKGSKQENMVVVPRRWWHGLHGRTLLNLVILLVALLVFWLGTLYEAGTDSGSSLIGRLAQARSADSGTINTLREELVKAEQASTVDRLAMGELRVNIQRLRQQISQLEEDVLFYKQITGAGNKSAGLVVSNLDLMATGQPEHYHYKLKFENLGNTSVPVEGYATIAVAGVKDNMELTLPLNVLSNTSQGDSIKLRFKAFQDVEGELALPYGFEPSRIEIVAVSEEPESKTLQKNFSWLVESSPSANPK